MPPPRPWVYSWLAVCATVAALVLWTARRWTHVQRPLGARHVPWQEFPFKAGDMLLPPSNIFTQLAVGCVWGHVAMVYRDPSNGMLYAWETCIPWQGVLWTFTTSMNQRAARLTPLHRYLHRCPKPVCVRALSREVDTQRFAQFVATKWNQPFGFDFLTNGANRVFADVVGVPGIKRTKGSARYCAELIAETMVHLGVLDFDACINPHLRTDHVIPRDFSAEHEHLPWATGWSLGPEILVWAKHQ